jgi:hypothetical protein
MTFVHSRRCRGGVWRLSPMTERSKSFYQGVESVRGFSALKIFVAYMRGRKIVRYPHMPKTPVLYGFSGPRSRYPVKSLLWRIFF